MRIPDKYYIPLLAVFAVILLYIALIDMTLFVQAISREDWPSAAFRLVMSTLLVYFAWGAIKRMVQIGEAKQRK